MAKKVDWINLGLAFGTTWALGVFFLGLMAWLVGWGTALVDAISSVYVGFAATGLGSVIGLFWGFVDGFIGGAIFAFVYNFICEKRGK